MLRLTGHVLIVTVVLSAGRLLACDFECVDALPTAVEVACHHEASDAAGPLVGGLRHECPQEALEPVAAATHKCEHVIMAGSPAARRAVLHTPPSILKFVVRPTGTPVPQSPAISVLRI